ncbi:hypothetical protein QL285_083666 [Trifolium repens]|nr:hypothetical protein QL285_083666 [Trifolium repens]
MENQQMNDHFESSENSTVKSTVSAASLFLLHRPQLLTTVMAKKKRFQNPLRSTLQTQAPAQGPTPVAPHQVAHQGSTSTNSLPQGPTPVAPTQGPTAVAPHQVEHQGPTPVDSSSAHEIPQQTQTSRQYVGRESADSWTVEAIDPQGVIKRIKLKYWQVNDLPIGQRVIVHFDEQAAAYGEAQGLLAGYIGTLAILSNLFPINFERWSGKYKGMPCSYFDNCFERLLKHLKVLDPLWY